MGFYLHNFHIILTQSSKAECVLSCFVRYSTSQPAVLTEISDGILKLLNNSIIDSVSLCSQAGRYDNPIPTRFQHSFLKLDTWLGSREGEVVARVPSPWRGGGGCTPTDSREPALHPSPVHGKLHSKLQMNKSF
jgi:hypothetical protein